MLNGKTGHILDTSGDVSTSTRDRKSTVAHSKTDSRYWLARVEKFARPNKQGDIATDNDYSCRVSFGGRRERFQLHTANKAEAASLAARIYRDVSGKGWEEALRIHKPASLPKVGGLPAATVGSLIEASVRLSTARPESMDTYAKALRRITAGVLEIKGGRKYDAHRGGVKAWREKIDAVELSALTPAAVLSWRNRLMKAARNPDERGRSAVTVNSLLRNAKALLSKKVRPFVEQEMQLPAPLFFEGITAEQEPSLRYRSTIDAGVILKAAQSDLAAQNPEAFKLLLLTLVCGLRRSEADTLLWEQFDFSKGVLVIEDNEHKRLKSRDSAGEIDLEPEICAIFRGFMAKTESVFVLEPSKRVRIADMSERQSRGYRSNETHKALLAWLREQGVKGRRPIHTLRKEIGAIIASRDGIWKASRYLRHSDIRITSKLYSDKKIPVTAGLGSLLATADNVIAADFGAAQTKPEAAAKKKSVRRRA